jgi:hypothetical protein
VGKKKSRKEEGNPNVFEKSIPVIDPALPVRRNPQKSGLLLLLIERASS